MLAELIDAVVGVDTHRDTHEVELALPTGTVIGTRKISNDSSGFAELLAWIVDHAPGPRVVVAFEGTRSFGVGLARAVAAAGLTVIECEQPYRKSRRGKGKSTRSTPIWRCSPRYAWMPIGYPYLAPTATARRCGSCSAPATNSPKSTPPRPTGSARYCWAAGTPNGIWPVPRSPIPCPSPWRGDGNHHRPAANRRCGTARSDAWLTPYGRGVTRWRPTGAQLQAIVDQIAPGLTERRGIGAVTAAQAIVSFSHPGRCRNDAAFAALSGTSPLQASSGKTVRHRLNRGGDRALNSAIHTIAITRMRCCPTTKNYVARRTAEGKSSREIQRCLKRYIARQHYRALKASTALTARTAAIAAAA
jgi:transposase